MIPRQEKVFENKKPAIEELCRAEKPKPSAVWFVFPFGSSPWNELSTELGVYFGVAKIIFLNVQPWSEQTSMRCGKKN